MRRKPSAAEHRLDPRELVARITAEHSSPSVRTGRSRHAADPATGTISTIPAPRTADASGAWSLSAPGDDGSDLGTDHATDTAPHGVATVTSPAPHGLAEIDHTAPHGLAEVPDTAPHGVGSTGRHELPPLDPDGLGPSPVSPMTGLPVISVADILAGHSVTDVPEDLEPVSGSTEVVDPPSGGTTVVEREDPEPRPKRGRRRAPRSRLRRFAPLTVAAAAVVVAGLVAMLLRPTPPAGPDLSASLVSSDTAQGTGTIATIPAPGALNDALARARDSATSTTLPPPPPVTATQNQSTARPSTGGGVVASAGDGVTAAAKFGWNQVKVDDFNNLANWSTYDGAGHDGAGRRTPSAVSTAGGVLTITGDSNGNTGGVSYNGEQRFGKWEMRAKFPAGDSQYHPVLILWPEGDNWPQGGEVDFAETNSAADGVSFFLHYGAANNQVSADKKLDITQWHNYAVEWTPNGITGYIDGVQWFQSTAGNTLPPGRMHPTIQLDYFPSGGNPQRTQMMVDWMRVYS